MKKKIITHSAALIIGILVGFAITKYWIVSPMKVTMEVCNMLSAFGISETNAPAVQILSLVWQAVENPRRREWTTSHQTWTEPVGPQIYFSETVESNSSCQLLCLQETNRLTQPTNPPYSSPRETQGSKR